MNVCQNPGTRNPSLASARARPCTSAPLAPTERSRAVTRTRAANVRAASPSTAGTVSTAMKGPRPGTGNDRGELAVTGPGGRRRHDSTAIPHGDRHAPGVRGRPDPCRQPRADECPTSSDGHTYPRKHLEQNRLADGTADLGPGAVEAAAQRREIDEEAAGGIGRAARFLEPGLAFCALDDDLLAGASRARPARWPARGLRT